MKTEHLESVKSLTFIRNDAKILNIIIHIQSELKTHKQLTRKKNYKDKTKGVSQPLKAITATCTHSQKFQKRNKMEAKMVNKKTINLKG